MGFRSLRVSAVVTLGMLSPFGCMAPKAPVEGSVALPAVGFDFQVPDRAGSSLALQDAAPALMLQLDPEFEGQSWTWDIRERLSLSQVRDIYEAMRLAVLGGGRFTIPSAGQFGDVDPESMVTVRLEIPDPAVDLVDRELRVKVAAGTFRDGTLFERDTKVPVGDLAEWNSQEPLDRLRASIALAGPTVSSAVRGAVPTSGEVRVVTRNGDQALVFDRGLKDGVDDESLVLLWHESGGVRQGLVYCRCRAREDQSVLEPLHWEGSPNPLIAGGASTGEVTAAIARLAGEARLIGPVAASDAGAEARVGDNRSAQDVVARVSQIAGLVGELHSSGDEETQRAKEMVVGLAALAMLMHAASESADRESEREGQTRELSLFGTVVTSDSPLISAATAGP